MLFPIIDLKNGDIQAKKYIDKYFMINIKKAAAGGTTYMILTNKGIDKLRYMMKIKTNFTISTFGTHYNGSDYMNLDRILNCFKELGYSVVSLGTQACIDWSKFMIPDEDKSGQAQGSCNCKGKFTRDQQGLLTIECNEIQIKPQQAPIQSKKSTINDFFYSAALQALKEKGSVEIHFLHSAAGQVLCIKPPSAEFLNFTTDLILLIDQRKEVGYEVSYRYGTNQEHLIVVTFPLTTAKKMIAELSI